MTPSLQSNPYQAEAGPELDAFIHIHVMKEVSLTSNCPPYSSNDKLANKVVVAVRASGRGSVITGRTTLKGRTWFARYETNTMDGAEVFAETYALAICRMALLRTQETDGRKRS